MSRSLFEEAIADAKQLREVAEQNAKKAIVEAVTPKIKEFIERQLTGDYDEMSDTGDFLLSSFNESDSDEEDVIIPPSKAKKVNEVDEDEVELSESALAALVNLVGSKSNKQITESDAVQYAFSRLSESEQNFLLKLASGSNLLESDAPAAALPTKAKSKEMSEKLSGDKKMNKSMQDLYELDLDDLDEDKIVIDFGKDIELDNENPYSVLVSSSEEEDEDVTLEEPPAEDEEAELPADGDEELEAAPEDSAQEGMVFELDENMLRAALAGLREAKNKKKDLKTSKNAAAQAFGGGKLTDMDEVVMNKFSNLKDAYVNEVRKNRVLSQQLNEYGNGLETLREQLSELNLFNAKLLYVNKLSTERDLTSAQRRHVVEALDGAKNLREAKLLYKSLSETLTRSNSASLNESARRLSPGHASRPTSSGGSTRLNESTQLDRWATLAGLK